MIQMKHKILLITALLCMAVQGVWAAWDRLAHVPIYSPGDRAVIIKSLYELEFIRNNWENGCGEYSQLYGDNRDFCQMDYILNADLDVSFIAWTPLSTFTGKFNGNGHTIRISIWEATDNYQGLFEEIGKGGEVKNLHVAAYIHCKSSRLVGGICGQNDGTIENCWVSGTVRSDWQNSSVSVKAKVGGICGENNGTVQYCCVTANVQNNDAHVGGLVGCNDGTLQHCTFYGERISSHDQASIYSGNSNNWQYCYGIFMENEYNDAAGKDMYRRAIKYPYSITVRNEGYGSVRVSAGGENDIPGWTHDNTVTLTQAKGLVAGVTIKDADGKNVSLQGQSSDVHSYWFVMPKSDVTATVTYAVNWPKQGAGTEDDPYLISNSEDWNQFAYYVKNGNSYSGKYVKLTADISVSTSCGNVEGSVPKNAFSGTFDGCDHTITATIADPQNECTALFSYIHGATIKNLKVAGSINSGQKHAAAIVGYSKSTGNSITNCAVTAQVSCNWYVGGIVAHSLDSEISVSGCVYSGLMTGYNSHKRVFIGWSDNGTKTVTNCLYIMQPGQDTGRLDLVKDGGTLTMTNCFKTGNVGSQGTRVYYSAPDDDITSTTTIIGNTVYVPCTFSVMEKYYAYTGNELDLCPTITAADGTVLTRGTDYTCTTSPATVKEKGEYTMLITAKDRCFGTKTFRFIVTDGTSLTSETTTLTTGEYVVDNNLEINERITISGDVTLRLREGVTYTAKKGIELSEGNSLTIAGFGTLNINGCDSGKSGIGAANVGTLTISGVTVNVTGGEYAAAIGGDKNNAKGGTITINSGVVNAKGGKLAAGIGGGADDQPGQYGVCGDITINGGQVTAQSGYRAEKYWRYGNMAGIGPGAEKPNPEGDYYDSGTLKLGWTKDTDFIDCSGFANPQGSTLTSITFADGKKFQLEGTETFATIENCRGKKIVPPVAPYIISNTAEWNDFVSSVNSGNSFKGKFVKLTADISVSTKCGTVEGSVQKNAFSGTFDGDGHTITATITDNSNQGTALFSYINGATIKNLKVAGCITGDMHAAAIVGFSGGKGNNITNCAATANVSGGTHIGGILGHGLSSDIAISGCTFSGLLTGDSSAKGAIFGWGDDGGVKSVTDCLYIMQDGQDTKGLDLVRKHAGDVKVTNTYKTTAAEHNGGQLKNARSLTSAKATVADGSTIDTTETDDSIYDAIWANEYDTMPDYFGNFVLDYGFMKVYEGGLEYDGKYYVANILMADDADNTALILLTDEIIADATLTGRTFYKDGTWQTICLPFDLDVLEGTPLEGAKVMTLADEDAGTGFDVATGTLTLDFVDADRIEAGKPYIVKWDGGADIVNPVFRGVTISDEDPIEQRTMSDDERVHFIGIYCPIQLEANNYANLYLGSDGRLHCPEADGFYLNAFRAGFLVDLGDEAAPSSIVTNLGDGTGIENVQCSMVNGQSDGWYTLDGRKLQGKPSRAGIYIKTTAEGRLQGKNGKKVVIK